MKWLNKLSVLAASAALLLVACEKEGALPFYEEGTPIEATASATEIAAPPADSNKVVLTVNWTDPAYSTAADNYRYLVQIDSAGRNFSKAFTREIPVTDSAGYFGRQTSFTAKQLNDIMLGYGFNFGQKYPLQVRVISSYANNNERLESNTIAINATPYKIPPKVVLPASGSIFIVGGGTDFGWNNDAGTPFNPARAFSRIDETTFSGIFRLITGDQYLILPEYGNWGKKYALDKNNVPGIADGGPFGYHEDGNPAFAGFNDNFITPGTTGLYKITLDFQRGTFVVAPFTQQHGLPSVLVAVGDGTPAGWDNPADNPYKFTRLSSSRWEQVITLTTGKEYLILPVPGSWDQKFGAEDNSKPGADLAGKFKPEGGNFKTPATTGSYKITLEFTNNNYTVVKQ